jgi:tetratricopeptide (TPR) repeat protein
MPSTLTRTTKHLKITPFYIGIQYSTVKRQILLKSKQMKQLFFLFSTLLLISYSHSQNAEEYLGEGMTKLFKLKDYTGAIADFNKAIQLSPKRESAYYYRGVAKFWLEDRRGAIVDFNKAIELDPNDAEAYSFRGISKSVLDDNRGAIADYDKAIELDPTNTFNYLQRGLCKVSIKQIDSGCMDFSKAGELGNEQAYELIREYCK